MTNEIVVQIPATPAISTELAASWLRDVAGTAATNATYIKGLRRLAEYFRAKNISTPTREDFWSYREYLGEKILDKNGNKKDRYAPATRNLYLTVARRFFDFLKAEGVLADNPATRVKGYKTGSLHKKSALAPADVKKILASIDTSTLVGKRNFALVALMATCGLRRVEVIRANVEDINFSGGQAKLHVQGKGKSDRAEFVVLPSGVYEAIAEYLQARGDVDDSAPLFASTGRNGGGRMVDTSVSRLVKSIFVAAGIDVKQMNVSCHSLRHSAATVALASGANLLEVQQLLRHKSISVTQIYLDELAAAANTAARRAAAAYGF